MRLKAWKAAEERAKQIRSGEIKTTRSKLDGILGESKYGESNDDEVEDPKFELGRLKGAAMAVFQDGK